MRQDRRRGYRQCRRRSPEQAAVIQNADDARADEQQRHFGLKDDGDREADRRDRPLQPVLHAELGEPITGMKDQRDDGGTDAVEDGGHRPKVAEIDVECAESGDDDEVRQDESPTPGPGAPEAAAQVGDIDADLNRKRSRQRLANRDRLAHLLLGEPFAVVDQLTLHLADQGNRAAKAEKSKA